MLDVPLRTRRLKIDAADGSTTSCRDKLEQAARQPFTFRALDAAEGNLRMRPKTPLLTVDCVVFDRAGRLLLIRRANSPFKGAYALPGGFVDVGETVEKAALRELREETGIAGKIIGLVGVYSDPKRDPRGHSVSCAFLVRPSTTKVKGGDDAASASFVDDWPSEKLAFDHAKIVADAAKLRG
jgi:8-oxo-dGTP diphosphatase